MRLYLPEAWTQGLEQCHKAGIPSGVGFQTKPEIALALLDQAWRWGIAHHCVVADADYGDNPNFLAELEERGEPYVVGVRADFRISLAPQAPRRRADQVLAAPASQPVGNHPVAAREPGLAPEEVRGLVLLAAYQEWGSERGLVAGGAARPRPASPHFPVRMKV